MSRCLRTAGLLAVSLGVAGCGLAAQGESVAATVNGHDISMVSYDKQVSYQRVNAQSNYNFDVCSTKKTAPLCIQVKRDALNTLIGNAIVQDYAARHHIVVTDAEFNRQWETIDKTRFHNQHRVVVTYAKSYGWTVGDLMASIREDQLQAKVLLAITRNLSRYSPAVRLSKIDVPSLKDVVAIKSQLRSGRTFDQLAAALNRDKKSLCHSEGGCGDLGWLPAALVPPGDKSVLTATPGTVVGPIPGQQLEELLRVQGRNKHYMMSEAQQYRVRQQNFAAWLNHQEKGASIRRNVQL